MTIVKIVRYKIIVDNGQRCVILQASSDNRDKDKCFALQHNKRMNHYQPLSDLSSWISFIFPGLNNMTGEFSIGVQNRILKRFDRNLFILEIFDHVWFHYPTLFYCGDIIRVLLEVRDGVDYKSVTQSNPLQNQFICGGCET